MFSNVFRKKFNHGISLQALLHPADVAAGPAPEVERRPGEPDSGSFPIAPDRPAARIVRIENVREPAGSA